MESFHGLVIGERKKVGGLPHSIYYSGSEEPRDSLKGGVNSYVSELSNKTLFNHAVGKEAEYIMVGGHDFGVRRKASQDRMAEGNLLGHMRAYLGRDLSTPEKLQETLLDLHNKIDSGMHLYDAGNMVSALLYKRAMQKGYGKEFIPTAQKALAAGALLAKDVAALNQGKAGEDRGKFIKESVQKISAGGNAGEVAELMGLNPAGLKALGVAVREPAVKAEPEPVKGGPIVRAPVTGERPTPKPEETVKERVKPVKPVFELPGSSQTAFFPVAEKAREPMPEKKPAESKAQLGFEDLPKEEPVKTLVPVPPKGLKLPEFRLDLFARPLQKLGVLPKLAETVPTAGAPVKMAEPQILKDKALLEQLVGEDPFKNLNKLREEVWNHSSGLRGTLTNIDLARLKPKDFNEFYSSEQGGKRLYELLDYLHRHHELGVLSNEQIQDEFAPKLMEAVGGRHFRAPEDFQRRVIQAAVENYPRIQEYQRTGETRELDGVLKGLLGIHHPNKFKSEDQRVRNRMYFINKTGLPRAKNDLKYHAKTPEQKQEAQIQIDEFNRELGGLRKENEALEEVAEQGPKLVKAVKRYFGLEAPQHARLLPTGS